MKTAFLRDGRKVSVNSELQGGFLVTPFLSATTWNGEDGEEQEYWEGLAKEPIFVDEIFATAPTEILDEQVILLESAIASKNHEIKEQENALRSLRYEIDAAKNEKTRVDKFIINRNEILQAKRICFFEKDRINPIDSKKETKGMKLNFSIHICNGEISIWGYKVYDNDRWDNGVSVDPKYGILIDLSDDELLSISKERSSGIMSDYAISAASDTYLNETQLERKRELAKIKDESERKSLEAEIKKLTERLDKLKGE